MPVHVYIYVQVYKLVVRLTLLYDSSKMRQSHITFLVAQDNFYSNVTSLLNSKFFGA